LADRHPLSAGEPERKSHGPVDLGLIGGVERDETGDARISFGAPAARVGRHRISHSAVSGGLSGKMR
jgi:hypothetical protein